MTGIPPLVCPADGLPPLGVDRGRNHLRDVMVVATLGITLGLLIARAGGHALEVDLFFFGGWLLATALHEIGHATAAYACGFRVIAIVVGPIVVRRSPRTGFRLRLRRMLLGGKVIAAPLRWEGEQRFLRDFAWFIVGGPATSLVAGALGLSLARRWTPFWDWSLISFVIGALTLIPARYQTGQTSDGEKLRRLRGADSLYLALMALRMMVVGVRPREWDPALVDVARAESESQGSDAIDATLLVYYRVLDSGDVAGAGRVLQRLIDYACGTVRWPRTTISGEVAFEACVFEAAWRGDYTAASDWLARAPVKKKRGSAPTIAKLLAKLQRVGLISHSATLERLSSSGSG